MIRGKEFGLLGDVEAYYSEKLKKFGATSRGVDWKDESSQLLRFTELLRTMRIDPNDSILDFGCGFGSLLPVLRESGFAGRYSGFDISAAMIDKAKKLHGEERASWITELSEGIRFDHVIASGIFNVKLGHSAEEWQTYMRDTLLKFDSISTKGFAFNVLTSYSDAEYQRADLHYADPLEWFHFCKTHFSSRVILNHGYPLYEFTLAVIKRGQE